MDQENYQFFLVVPPGFEGLALKELNHKFFLPGRVVYGGVEIEGPLERGYILNHYLKIPNRILLRIDEFKCRDFPKLFQSLSKIKLQKFLPNRNFKIKVASSKSRLLNEKRILKIAEDVFKPELNEAKYVHNIYIRFFDDICTVSVDTSGDSLYKRGEKELVNEAPIRENLAAGLLLALLYETDSQHQISLLDPMCGSGTFLLEAHGLYKPSKSRVFSFQKFIKKVELPPLVDLAPIPVKELIGFDIDEKCIKITKENLKNIKIPVELLKTDFFNKANFQISKGKNLFIIINPPYGKKIKLPKAPLEFYSDLIQQATNFKPTMFGCILPERYSKLKIKLDSYKLKDQIQFQNGGIDVVFNIYKRMF